METQNSQRQEGSLLGGPPKGMGPPGGLGMQTVTLGEALTTLIMVSIPIVLQLVLGYMQAIINFSFITSYDDSTLLAGLGLGMSFYVCFYSSFMIGMCSTITTFAAQLRGMGQVKTSGIYLNAGRMITFVLSFPIMAILWWSEEILLAIGQDAAVSYQASRFCIGLVPSVTLFGFTNMHMYFLNSFQKTRPGMISAVSCIFIQLFFNWLFIYQWNWGILGAGLALSVSKAFQSVYLFIALYYYDEIREALFWPTWDETQWTYVKNFLGLGFPSLCMSFLEITGVELFQPLSGLISVNANSAQAIVMVIYAGVFIIFMGISIACSIFVGRFVGQFNIPAAKMFARASIIYVLSLTVFMVGIIWAFNYQIVSSYTSDPEIQGLAIDATYVLLVAIFPVAIVYSQVGTLRGLGKQRVAASIQIFSLFFISLPIGCYLAFVKEMSVAGFWVGFLFRTIGAAAIFLFLLWRVFDWDEIARNVRDRERAIRERIIVGSPSKKPSDYGSINQQPVEEKP